MRKKDDEKQNSIKRAVVQLILTEGFHGASVAKIAKAAGVSPATVYIYYENKDAMLRDLYKEYAEEMFEMLIDSISTKMSGEQIIDTLVRGYYNHIISNEEVFNFVEQYSNCPSLSGSCSRMKGPARLEALLTELKENHILYDYNNDNLYAILFYPVKAIANRACPSDLSVEQRLTEMIAILQRALVNPDRASKGE